MPRNMSFALTTEQMRRKEKDVTRRFAWWTLKLGTQIWAVEKAMGLKRGEKVKRIGLIEVVNIRFEPLNAITHEDCRREGFPDLSPEDFVGMLMSHHKCKATETVNRIEFRHLY